jgi:hypothetical protein
VAVVAVVAVVVDEGVAAVDMGLVTSGPAVVVAVEAATEVPALVVAVSVVAAVVGRAVTEPQLPLVTEVVAVVVVLVSVAVVVVALAPRGEFALLSFRKP